MNQEQKGKKQAQKTAKKANMQARPNQRAERQKKTYLILGLVLVLLVFSAVVVPVSYIPLLNNIAHKFGLSTEITRQLTLVDLALDSLGVETARAKEAFKQNEVNDAPSPILYSRYEPEISHLINARETYYYEYERTRRRPDEIAGVYKDGQEVATPNLKQDKVKGVRALPSEDYLDDAAAYGPQDYESSAVKSGTAANASRRRSRLGPNGAAYTVSADEISADGTNKADARKVRRSFDKETGKSGESSAMPSFVSTVYANNSTANSGTNSQTQTAETQTETLDINNSRMIKPVFKGENFNVSKRDTPMETLFGSSDFVRNLNSLRFGGHEALGFFVADDVPTSSGLGNLKTLKRIGNDVLNAYFYSYLAPNRKYQESAKYLSDAAFTGEEVKEEVLLPRGQENTKPPVIASNSLTPIEIQVIDSNRKECADARVVYLQNTASLVEEYSDKKNELLLLTMASTDNYGWGGAPGYCEQTVKFNPFKYKKRDPDNDPNGTLVLDESGNVIIETFPSMVTADNEGLSNANHTGRRDKWNILVEKLEELCVKLQKQERQYLQDGCGFKYSTSSDHDTCESIQALKVGIEPKTYDIVPSATNSIWEYKNAPFAQWAPWTWSDCHEKVKWENPRKAQSINVEEDCVSEVSCQTAIVKLFTDIDTNIVLEPNGDFF